MTKRRGRSWRRTLYDELRRLAAAHMRRGYQSETIQPTSLVHEAYLRLAHQNGLEFQNRAQFFGLSAQVMRTVPIAALAVPSHKG